MSTIAEIQQAIERLPRNEKSALSAWLQSQEEPVMSQAEEAALLASLDRAAAGKGVPIERVREDIRRWATE
jgi:predicted transcriptional regulator